MAFLLTRTLRTRPASVNALCRTAQTSKFITVGAPAPGPAVPQQVKLFFHRMRLVGRAGCRLSSSRLRGVTSAVSPPSGVPSPAAAAEPATLPPCHADLSRTRC